MKTRITPLNFLASVLLLSCVYGLAFEDDYRTGALLLFGGFILVFIVDLLFRRTVGDLKRIWLYELVFVIFVAVMIFLIKTWS